MKTSCTHCKCQIVPFFRDTALTIFFDWSFTTSLTWCLNFLKDQFISERVEHVFMVAARGLQSHCSWLLFSGQWPLETRCRVSTHQGALAEYVCRLSSAAPAGAAGSPALICCAHCSGALPFHGDVISQATAFQVLLRP